MIIDFSEKENRITFKTLLEAAPIEVTFDKANGETRVMRCTLNLESISEDKLPKKETEVIEKDIMDTTALRVFDLDLQEWRSFRWDSVKSISLPI